MTHRLGNINGEFMNESILQSIKKLLGLAASYEDFDEDIIILINTFIPTLAQLGLESARDYMITDATNVWSELLGTHKNLNAVKTFIFLKVKQAFDPPTSSAVSQANDSIIKELEFRLMHEFEFHMD